MTTISMTDPTALGPTENPGAGFFPAAWAIGLRTVKQFIRSPQLIVAGTAQGALFLLIFRYVFGGAVGGTGTLSYVDFLVPGFVMTSVLFQGMGAATGIADDLQSGLVDRLRSLPISLGSIISGRIGADTTMVTWGLAVTTAIGFLVGFRVHDGLLPALAAFGLCVLFGMAFCWLFVALGLLSGSPQAAQGLSFMVFPLTFVSSAYVPVGTMPGWMQAFATHQPITVMSNAVRILCQGHAAEVIIGYSLRTEVLTSLAWTVGIIAVFAPLAISRLRRS
jgi:ABC-2 type transport system permease protein